MAHRVGNGNGTGTHTSIPVVVAGDDWDDATSPDPEVAVTNAALLRVLRSLAGKVDGISRGLKWLAISVATMAGALVLFGLFILWLR